MNEGWNDAIMHVPRNEEVKFLEAGGDFGISKVDGRVNDGDFDFVLREFGDEFLVKCIEICEHNVAIFAAGME